MIDVAEVFRRFAADYLEAHGASMLPSLRWTPSVGQESG
mgnify:CR=1 FL=1